MLVNGRQNNLSFTVVSQQFSDAMFWWTIREHFPVLYFQAKIIFRKHNLRHITLENRSRDKYFKPNYKTVCMNTISVEEHCIHLLIRKNWLYITKLDVIDKMHSIGAINPDKRAWRNFSQTNRVIRFFHYPASPQNTAIICNHELWQ